MNPLLVIFGLLGVGSLAELAVETLPAWIVIPVAALALVAVFVFFRREWDNG
jgi:uncharacterized membrane protein